MEIKSEADSNDISAECCSHHYQPTVGMFVCFFNSQQLFVNVSCFSVSRPPGSNSCRASLIFCWWYYCTVHPSLILTVNAFAGENANWFNPLSIDPQNSWQQIHLVIEIPISVSTHSTSSLVRVLVWRGLSVYKYVVTLCIHSELFWGEDRRW